jgi:hypothetical protein
MRYVPRRHRNYFWKGNGRMKKSLLFLILVVPVLLAASLEVGSSQYPSTKPFCGD